MTKQELKEKILEIINKNTWYEESIDEYTIDKKDCIRAIEALFKEIE